MIQKYLNTHRDLLQQIMRFVLVGGTATLLDMVILYVLNSLFGVHHLVAATIAFVLATFYNYYMSMKFVFKSRYTDSASKRKEIIIFYTLSICGLIITLIGLAIFVDGLHLPVMISKIVVGVFVMMFNFITRKIFLENKE